MTAQNKPEESSLEPTAPITEAASGSTQKPELQDEKEITPLVNFCKTCGHPERNHNETWEHSFNQPWGTARLPASTPVAPERDMEKKEDRLAAEAPEASDQRELLVPQMALKGELRSACMEAAALLFPKQLHPRIPLEATQHSASVTIQQTVESFLLPVINFAEWGWTIIANASGGDWSKESADWQEAAARYRDEFHAKIRLVPSVPNGGVSSNTVGVSGAAESALGEPRAARTNTVLAPQMQEDRLTAEAPQAQDQSELLIPQTTLQWTSMKPETPGWYWFRENDTGVPLMTLIRLWPHLPQVTDVTFYRKDAGKHWSYLSDADGEWLGPLEAPSDPSRVSSDAKNQDLKEPQAARAKRAEVPQMALLLRAADKMAWVCDDWVQRGIIDSRSALADARLDYGHPFRYEWSKLEAPSLSEKAAKSSSAPRVSAEGESSVPPIVGEGEKEKNL